MSASDIAKALGGRRGGDGGYLCRCPVAGHGKGDGDRHPSLSIRAGETAVLVRCFAGCDSHEVLEELRRRGLLENPGGRRPSGRPDRHDRPRPVEEPGPNPEAIALWRAGVPLQGTLGERYLHEHRCISLAPPPSLRFHPAALYPHTGHSFPAIVAAVQRPDRTIVAVQVTYLRPSDGAKAPVSAPRLTVGRLGTGAVRLGPAGEVLGLAEGVEDALSAMELSGVPCWGLLGGQRLAKAGIPAYVREVHIFGNDDAAGQLAAGLAAERYSRDGLRVVLRFPPSGFKDWNDVLRARDRQVAA